MSTSIKQMNNALFLAASHLHKAGAALGTVEEFRPDAKNLFNMSIQLLDIIVPEQEKVSPEKMRSILDEILAANPGPTNEPTN